MSEKCEVGRCMWHGDECHNTDCRDSGRWISAAEETKPKYEPLLYSHIILNEEEIRALGRILEREWINQEDEEAYAVVNRIFRTINDMDSRTNNVNE